MEAKKTSPVKLDDVEQQEIARHILRASLSGSLDTQVSVSARQLWILLETYKDVVYFNRSKCSGIFPNTYDENGSLKEW